MPASLPRKQATNCLIAILNRRHDTQGGSNPYQQYSYTISFDKKYLFQLLLKKVEVLLKHKDSFVYFKNMDNEDGELITEAKLLVCGFKLLFIMKIESKLWSPRKKSSNSETWAYL